MSDWLFATAKAFKDEWWQHHADCECHVNTLTLTLTHTLTLAISAVSHSYCIFIGVGDRGTLMAACRSGYRGYSEGEGGVTAAYIKTKSPAAPRRVASS